MNERSRIRAGVIGVGNMGKNHLRVIKELADRFELVGVFDQNDEAIRKTGYDGRVFGDACSLMDESDAVVIAVPSSLHREYALRAAQRGLHALIEKPLGLSAEEAAEICAVYKGVNRVAMVGHIERYNPVVLELERVLQNEEILAVNISRCSPMDLHINDADVIYDLMIHDVDILINSLNSGSGIESLSAVGRTVYNKSFADYVEALFRFDNGVLASVTSSRATEDKIRTIDIHCRGAFIKADMLNRTITLSRKTSYHLDVGYDPTYRQENVTERVFVPSAESLRNELSHFADCIDFGVPCRTSPESALQSLRVLDRIRERIYDGAKDE